MDLTELRSLADRVLGLNGALRSFTQLAGARSSAHLFAELLVSFGYFVPPVVGGRVCPCPVAAFDGSSGV